MVPPPRGSGPARVCEALRGCRATYAASDEALALGALVESAVGMTEDLDEYVAELREVMKSGAEPAA